MKIVEGLIQGSPEWHRHRATHRNASDAPAMMGASKYRTRSDLLRSVATGVIEEIDDATQKRFDTGHLAEAAARPMAEKLVGDDLYPIVAVSDDDSLSASFDGITLDGQVVWEHKLWNEAKAEYVRHGNIPVTDYWQCVQQALVSGCERLIYMVSDGAPEHEAHVVVRGDDLRARALELAAGWAQFDADVAAYQVGTAAPQAVVGRAPETLPALRVEAQGMVTFSNLAEFKDHALAVLGGINRELKTDEDFADAEQTVKWCKGVESKLEATKAQVLGQMQTVDEAVRTIDDVAAETRRVRLELDRLVKAEKEHRKAEIVQHYVEMVRQHYTEINKTLGEFALPVPASLASDIGGSIKGLKTLGSITDAADTACANAKISASQQAERVRACMKVLGEFITASNYALFPDRVMLCHDKSLDDLRNLAKARVAEADERERQKLEAERERIRAEEQAKVERAERLRQQAVAEVERRCVEAVKVAELPHADLSKNVTIKLGEINARIAPLSITAAGLAQLGFQPVGHDKAAKLYAAADLAAMLDTMISVILGSRGEEAA